MTSPDPTDPHALVLLEKVLAENDLDPLAFLRAFLEDRVPPVIIWDGVLFVAQSDLHSWKSRLRTASLGRKAAALERRRQYMGKATA